MSNDPDLVVVYIAGVDKLRLFELFEKFYNCFLFFISIAKCKNIVKWYCGS